eukprot:8660922-Pyramimonas_sp.AAC.1
MLAPCGVLGAMVSQRVSQEAQLKHVGSVRADWRPPWSRMVAVLGRSWGVSRPPWGCLVAVFM